MQGIGKALIAGGLVVMTGPFCLHALAQGGYVDLEAERAAAAAAGMTTSAPAPAAAPTAPADPYAAQPAQAYPATSFGVGSAPEAPATTAAPSGAEVAPAAAAPAMAAPAGGSANLGTLFSQIQQLQQEVMRLNGRVEEQAQEIRELREQSLQRYVDLDKRLSGGAAAAGPASAGPGSAPAPTPAQPGIDTSAAAVAPAIEEKPLGVEQPGESEAYQAAYALVQGRQFPQAITAFQQFLQTYPGGKYAPNAYYWLGELYLVIEPADLEASRQAFAMLLSQYPDNSKAPDALYKLGKVQFMKGNREKAREYLDLVIRQYGATNNPVVKLARDFIAQNY